jgi:hypothetical protein
MRENEVGAEEARQQCRPDGPRVEHVHGDGHQLEWSGGVAGNGAVAIQRRELPGNLGILGFNGFFIFLYLLQIFFPSFICKNSTILGVFNSFLYFIVCCTIPWN